jgi:hypothetical protein
MAGVLVEYARFVEVQQRRARVVAQLTQPLQDTPAETNGLAAVEDHPVEIGESRGLLRSMHNDAAPQPIRDRKRGHRTTPGSVDVG